MLFWIFAAIAVAVFAYSILEAFDWGGIGEVFVGLLKAAVVSLIGLAILSVLALTAPATDSETQTETIQLQALGSGSEFEGRSYFLGGGYVNEERVLNFIREQDGYSVLDSAKAEDSRIFQDESDRPYLEIVTTYKEVWWVAPGNLTESETYNFHIPEGSILENYTITNG